MLVSHSLVDDVSTFKLSALRWVLSQQWPLQTSSLLGLHPPPFPAPEDASLSAKGKQMTGCCLELPWLPARDPCTQAPSLLPSFLGGGRGWGPKLPQPLQLHPGPLLYVVALFSNRPFMFRIVYDLQESIQSVPIHSPPTQLYIIIN